MAVVYQHIRKDNNHVFNIGIGKEEKRAYSKDNRNPHWHNTVKKYGYEVEILFDNVTWDEACMFERNFIHLHGRADKGLGPLVNQTDGGDGQLGNTGKAYKRTDEIRKVMSEKMKGNTNSKDRVLSNCHKTKIGKANSVSINQIDIHTKEIIKTWDSMMEAERVTGVHNSKISMVCKGKRKSAGGFGWEYLVIE